MHKLDWPCCAGRGMTSVAARRPLQRQHSAAGRPLLPVPHPPPVAGLTNVQEAISSGIGGSKACGGGGRAGSCCLTEDKSTRSGLTRMHCPRTRAEGRCLKRGGGKGGTAGTCFREVGSHKHPQGCWQLALPPQLNQARAGMPGLPASVGACGRPRARAAPRQQPVGASRRVGKGRANQPAGQPNPKCISGTPCFSPPVLRRTL